MLQVTSSALVSARYQLYMLEQKIKDDPGSEEQQGKNLVDAALKNRVECFVWSTLPSSEKISGGRIISRIYEGPLPTSLTPVLPPHYRRL